MTIEFNDNTLALARRLDWRFVFANPHLNHVVIAGEIDHELFHALHAFSDQVSIWQGQDVESCNMLIMHNPSPALFRRVMQAVNPMCFYLEFEASGPLARLRQTFDVAYCIRIAQRNGHHNIRSFWHWPEFAKANRIIPLSQSEALFFVLSKGHNDFKTRLKVAGLGLLQKTNLLTLFIKGVGVAGDRLI